MTVDARLGLFRDRVRVEGREYEVQRGRAGWRQIVDAQGPVRRIRYDSWRDRILVESPEGSAQIQFRWRNTTFSWKDRLYRIRSSMWSGMTILDRDRPVAQGQSTWSGFRFDFVAPDFQPIARELAIGLGLRAAAFAIAMAPV